MEITQQDMDRFYSKVQYDDEGCWLWTGCILDTGYGQVWMDGKPRGAHVVAWVWENGPVPAGHLVRHTCDTPSCVRYDHLLTGTPKENTADMMQRGRHKPGPGHVANLRPNPQNLKQYQVQS